MLVSLLQSGKPLPHLGRQLARAGCDALLVSLPGAAAAEAVARSVFGAHAALGGPALPLALAVALLLSLGASAWPVRRALSLSPSEILRAP